MKHRACAMAGAVVLLLAALAFFPYAKEESRAPVPEPSCWGGYYDQPFVLELSAPENGSIYYTLDGSVPTRESARYQDGIEIQDRSQEPNLYSSIRNVVTDWQRYTPDTTPVPKGTVVRAVYINELGIESEVLTQTYFVGMEPPETGYTLSLVFEYEDLFGDEGIYVTGKAYDDWYLSDGDPARMPVPNYEQDLEAVAQAELMDSAGYVMNQPVGLQIQGASARGAAKKRFTLTAREEYSGSQTFDAMLYDGVITHSVMLKDCLPEAILPELVADRDVSVQQCVPVQVYLNGEFWYTSYMLERYDNQYFRQYYEVNNRILVKDGEMDQESLAALGLDVYREFLYWVQNTDFSDPEQWAQIQQETDIQSYIDYLAINYCMGNYDFYDEHNYVLWRSLYPGSGEYEDMRWRWCIYDIDVMIWAGDDPGFDDHAALNLFTDPAVYGIANTSLYRALKGNEDFCRQFVLSFQDIVNNNFAPERVEQVLAQYGYDLDWMDGFFRRHPAYALSHLAEEFGLTGTLETVEITVQNPDGGTVTVNTSQIDLSEGTWSGQYYTDYPITVTAQANPGYRFAGWKGDSDGTETTITVRLDGGAALEAVFLPE